MKSPFASFNFILGIYLEISSVILCVLISSSLYYGGGFPLVQLYFITTYSMGAHYIFKSSIPRAAKLITVFWWVAAIVIWGLYTLTVYGVEYATTRNETYLLPQGYHGEVNVYFGQPDGDAPVFEDNSLLFTTNKNGEVRTTYQRRLNKLYDNNTHLSFFFVDEQGHRTPILLRDDPSLLPGEVFATANYYEYDSDNTEISKVVILVFTQQEMDDYYKTGGD